MNTTSSRPPLPASTAPKRAKWWGYFKVEGDPPQQRLIIRWPRILFVGLVAGLVCFLSLATALWGYYSVHRKIPNVKWTDVVTLRLSRMQASIGEYYLTSAKDFWAQGQYMQAITTGRAAVIKAPANLEARFFLASCWQQAGRADEAIRVMREGMQWHAADSKFQKRLVELCIATSRHEELLKFLREDWPAQGVRLLDTEDPSYRLAEIHAVLDTAGADAAQQLAATRTELNNLPAAAPLLARIDWEQDRREIAFQRLNTARQNAPEDAAIQDAYIETALRMEHTAEARAAAAAFLKANPNLATAQLRFLETHGNRIDNDRLLWLSECLRFMAMYQQVPAALQRLGNLAAVQGWSDLTFLLYQNSLQENLAGFPFVDYYIASLIKTGEIQKASTAWDELTLHNNRQLTGSVHIRAMILWAQGNQAEALQIAERLRRDAPNNNRRQRELSELFRSFGYKELALEVERRD
jgi:tetratricopeptide (TPR) repeat protein